MDGRILIKNLYFYMKTLVIKKKTLFLMISSLSNFIETLDIIAKSSFHLAYVYPSVQDRHMDRAISSEQRCYMPFTFLLNRPRGRIIKLKCTYPLKVQINSPDVP